MPRGPTFHCGTCSSSAARFAHHTSVGRSSTTTKSSVSRPVELPGVGIVAVRTQSGVWEGAFFSKNLPPSTPSGHRIRVAARSFRCGSIAGATRT
ncbi:hypothetical protein LUX39_41445 [Actinomadura madurae]|nr:hypothetical protein [Actinomadura madurae]MCQ0019450.1 hypothetical protein [Actinomadura madurae]